MDWFWHVLLVCFIVVPITVMWLAIAIEIFRRHDLNGFARVGWLLGIFFFPLIGCLTYVTVTWLRAGSERNRSRPSRGRQPADPSTAKDLAELDRLQQAGVLTDSEFAEAKRRVLEAPSGRHASEEVGS
jgi:hypothetical protein